MQGKNGFNNIKNQLWFILFVRLFVSQVPVHEYIVHKHSIQCIIILCFEMPFNDNRLLFCIRIAIGSASMTSLENFKLLSLCKVINTKA